jgi:hypothetical protein
VKVLGVDPAVDNAALAWFDTESLVMDFAMVKAKRKIEDPRARSLSVATALARGRARTGDLLVVEGQEYYAKGTKARPEDIVNLAFSAGVVCGVLAPGFGKVLCPLPRIWAKQTPKNIRHVRLCKALDMEHEVRGGGEKVVVTDSRWPHIVPGDWEHLLDALGLAAWGSKQL